MIKTWNFSVAKLLLRICVLAFLTGILCTSLTSRAENQPPIVIGLVDTFSPDFYIHTYSPTLDHLMKALPGRKFRFLELDYRDVEDEVRREKPDFLVTSASTYVGLIDTVGTLQIASRESKLSKDPSQAVASVFIVRQDSPIKNLEQSRNARVAITAQTSFDGWLIAQGEIARHGWNPHTFFSSELETQYGIPDVASFVKLKLADIGILPACELERLEQQHAIQAQDFRVIDAKPSTTACQRSTDLYPDVVFSSLPSADPETVRSVAIALLSMPCDQLDFQWTIANDFVPTFQLMKTLHIGPFAEWQEWSLETIWQNWKTEILLGLGLCLAVLFHIITINVLVQRRTRQLSIALAETQCYYHEAQDTRQKLLTLERTSIVSQLSSLFAHEIKQPIMSISLYAGALRLLLQKTGMLTPKAEQILSGMAREVDRSSQIIEHVRSYAKARTRQKIHLDLVQTVQEAIALFRGKPLEIKLPPDATCCNVLGDPFEIQFIVTNFINNALAAASKTGPAGHVQVSFIDEGEAWKIAVSDNGPRLSDESFARLGTVAPSTKPDGLGFGLSIASALAEASGGHLEFHRLEPSGLQACLVLPKEHVK